MFKSGTSMKLIAKFVGLLFQKNIEITAGMKICLIKSPQK